MAKRRRNPKASELALPAAVGAGTGLVAVEVISRAGKNSPSGGLGTAIFGGAAALAASAIAGALANKKNPLAGAGLGAAGFWAATGAKKAIQRQIHCEPPGVTGGCTPEDLTEYHRIRAWTVYMTKTGNYTDGVPSGWPPGYTDAGYGTQYT